MKHRDARLEKEYFRDEAPECQGEGNIRMKHRDAEWRKYLDKAPECRGGGNIRMKHRDTVLEKEYYRNETPDAGLKKEYYRDEAPGCRI